MNQASVGTDNGLNILFSAKILFEPTQANMLLDHRE